MSATTPRAVYNPATAQRARLIQNILIYLLLTLAALVVIFPILLALSISVQSNQAMVVYPPKLIPDEFHLENFIEVQNRLPILRYVLNSFVMSSLIAFAQIITASSAAFAFSFLSFKGRNLLFFVFLSTMMIPWEVTIIPNYQTITSLGLKDNYLGLSLPFMATAFGTFLLRQSFMSIPTELQDAATIDGCGNLRFLTTILLPLARPALGTLGVYSFVQAWNQYLWPLLVTNQRDMRTVQIGIGYLRAEEGTLEWNIIMAGVILVLLPTVLVLIVGQKQLIRGLTAGAVKG